MVIKNDPNKVFHVFQIHNTVVLVLSLKIEFPIYFCELVFEHFNSKIGTGVIHRN